MPRRQVTPEQFLDRLAAVRIDRSHGGRAPHKPLLLLLALGRVGLGPEGRLIPYETADERFKALWEEFGRPDTPPRVHYPFGRLRNDDRLWEIPEESQLSTGRAADIRVSEARRLGITGGFRQDVHDLAMPPSELVSRAAHQILFDHFPPSIHQDILDAVRLAAGPSSDGFDERDPHSLESAKWLGGIGGRYRQSAGINQLELHLEILATQSGTCSSGG